MQLRELGEAGLIEKISGVIAASGGSDLDQARRFGYRLSLPIGDDAAAWSGVGGPMIITTDTLVEDVHFRLSNTTWDDLGWKVMAVNLSDIAAMGCLPLYSVVTLGLHGEILVDDLMEMYSGMLEACTNYGGGIVGGDVVNSRTLFISVTMVGAAWSKCHRILKRSAARIGDKVAVTGSLGCSSGGLSLLASGRDLDLDLEPYNHLRKAHNRPLPLVEEGKILSSIGVAAAIDVSDGLLYDLGKLCKSSGVGAAIYSNKVPVDEFLRQEYPHRWLSLALHGGEDFQILFTASTEVVEEARKVLGVPVSIIGDIVEEAEGVNVVDEYGCNVEVPGGAWEHFI